MTELKLMAASWARVAIAAMLATIADGVHSWREIFVAGAVAVIPPVLRWLNPNDMAYGIKSTDD